MSKNNYFWLLILSLGLNSGFTLIDKLVVPLPNWLAIVVIMVSGASLIAFLVKTLKTKK